MGRRAPAPVHAILFQANVNIYLPVLRVLRPLIINFKICLIRPLDFAFLFKLENALPGIGNDFGEGANFGREHRIFSRRNLLHYQAIWRSSSVLYSLADKVCVLAIVIAGVFGIHTIKICADGARNFSRYFFSEKFLPLLRDNSVGSRLSRIISAGFDSNKSECGYIRWLNGALRGALRCWAWIIGSDQGETKYAEAADDQKER